MSGVRRRSYEAGHRPKFLAVVDGAPESGRAIYYAARRAARLGAVLTLLAVVTPGDFGEWLGVGDVMRAEAETEARERLALASDLAHRVEGVEIETVLRTGERAGEIVALIEEDEDIAVLVLAAGAGKEGPGPLVSTLAGRAAASFPIPIAIVPGHLTDEEIDALT
jgi:nucleotide-binding universal stress UspA family protein